MAEFLPFSLSFPHALTITVIAILSSFLLSGHQRVSNLLLILAIISLAATLYLNSRTFAMSHISRLLGGEKLTTGAVGVVVSPALTRRPYYGKIGSTCLFRVEAIGQTDGWQGAEGLAMLRIQTEKDYSYGDRLLVKGTIRNPKSKFQDPKQPQNPELRKKHFNYGEYLTRQNIYALINTKENNVTILSHDYKSNPIIKYTYLIRERLKGLIVEKMPVRSGAFLRAILLGDRSELPKDLKASFKKSGTMHVMAISGLHVGLIAFIIIYLLRALRIKRGFSYVFTIIFLIFFALLTLCRPSVVRATVMACVFLVGMLLGRRIDVYNSLGMAALVILIKNPKDLFNVGFQLSFLAVLSIVYFTPRILKVLRPEADFRIRRYLYTPLAVSLSAWVATFPLIIYHFRIITPIAVFANLLIIPALFVLLVSGVGLVLFGWAPFAGSALAGLTDLCANIVFFLADFFASLRFGHFHL